MEAGKMSVEVKLPEKCTCGFENLNIWGTRIKGRLKIEVRCSKCGKPLWRFE